MLSAGLQNHLGSAAKNAHNKELKNVGPSVQYKLRDKNGQAREYQNYMQQVLIDDSWVFQTGIRYTTAAPISFLIIPRSEVCRVGTLCVNTFLSQYTPKDEKKKPTLKKSKQ